MSNYHQIPQIPIEVWLLRQMLWYRHGCPIVELYGDDGEMQCNSGRHLPIDFLRMPASIIHQILTTPCKETPDVSEKDTAWMQGIAEEANATPGVLSESWGLPDA